MSNKCQCCFLLIEQQTATRQITSCLPVDWKRKFVVFDTCITVHLYVGIYGNAAILCYCYLLVSFILFTSEGQTVLTPQEEQP